MDGRGNDDESKDFFVSHADSDVDWAEWISHELGEAGFTVELSVWDWSAGSSWMERLEHAVARAGRIIAVLSPAYFEDAWLRFQSHTAAFEQMKRHSDFVIPVVVKPCEDKIPPTLRLLSALTLVGLDETEARRAIRSLRPRERPAPGAHVPYPGGRNPFAFPGALSAAHNLPVRNPFFTGRDRLLRGIREQLASAPGPGRVALQGEGGVGKSQLAWEHAWRHVDSYDVLWQVTASESTGIDTAIMSLATALGLPVDVSPEDRTRRVHGELAKLRALVIFDNVEDPGWLDDLPPADVIVTCRDPAVSVHFPSVIPVDVFSRDDAVLFLRRRSPELSDAEADAVAAALGDLPLAVSQAADYLGSSNDSARSYLARLGVSDPDAAEHVGSEVVRPLAPVGAAEIKATTVVALRRLGEVDPGALELLRCLAFLAPERVPLRAVSETGVGFSTGALVVSDPETTGEIVNAIERLGLARGIGRYLHIHRRVQEEIRKHLATPEHRRAYLQRALRLLATAEPGDPARPENWRDFNELLPHLLAAGHHLDDTPTVEPAAFRALVIGAGHYLYNAGYSFQTEALAQAAWSRWQVRLGQDDIDTLRIAHVLALSRYGLGQYESAVRLHRDTWERQQRILGDDDPDTLRSAGNLAAALRRSGSDGSYEEAAEIHKATWSRRDAVLGPDDPDTLKSKDSYAVSLRSLGRYDDARILHEQALATRRRVLGADHPDTLRSAANLAVALHLLGRVTDARDLQLDTLAKRRAVLGENHQDTMWSANNAARALADAGDRAAAQELFEDTRARQELQLGANHLETRRTANNLSAMQRSEPWPGM
jgi:tetratricopeptide (TPR) repeat protein